MVTLSCIWKGNLHFFQWFPTAYQDTVSFILSCSIEMLLRNRGNRSGRLVLPTIFSDSIQQPHCCFSFHFDSVLIGLREGCGSLFSFSCFLFPIFVPPFIFFPMSPWIQSPAIYVNHLLWQLSTVGADHRFTAGGFIFPVSGGANYPRSVEHAKQTLDHQVDGVGIVLCFPNSTTRARSNVIKLATGQFPFRLLAGRVFAIFG